MYICPRLAQNLFMIVVYSPKKKDLIMPLPVRTSAAHQLLKGENVESWFDQSVKSLTEVPRVNAIETSRNNPETADQRFVIRNRNSKFLESVVEIIEKKMNDPQFSVKELSNELAISRSTLHKKLKALSGYVPNNFITIIRLRKAVQLLLSTEYSIAEISYLVGFNSASYFSSRFRVYFKMRPTDFLYRTNEAISSVTCAE